MFTKIKKRDGREVEFNDAKITDAIFKAAQAVGGEDRQTAVELTVEVLRLLKKQFNGNIFTVEDVQDAVEKVLIEAGHAKTAKAYILYRAKRTRIREGKSELMDTVADILVETNRENANIGNSPSAKMLQIASAASKRYYLTRLIPEEFSLAHIRGDIHIHDLDFYAKTLNCIQIPLGKLLKSGFNNGHGYIRPPKRPGSATALAAIILQSSQNDMFGGQSFPFFDRDIAEFVKDASEDETFQAMEALIYNLNSMHSLRGRERIWVFDRDKGQFYTISMEEFHRQFKPGRFAALSLNYQTGRTELKDITASMKHPNFNRLLRVRLKSGQCVEVTDNHSLMTLNENGEITTAMPEAMRVGLTPARWQIEAHEHIYDLSRYPASRRYPMAQLKLDENLARFLGFYVAEGSVDGSAIQLALFDEELEFVIKEILQRIHPDFSVRLRYRNGKKADVACRVGRTFASFVGDICGRGAANKRVPSELFLASESIIRAFLDGYLSGDGSVSGNRVTATTISSELRDGIYLLLVRLGIPAYMRQYYPQTRFASVCEQYKIAVGGYYATSLSLSGRKGENLADLYRVTTEQTQYDYEYLRPHIARVYGIHSRNAHQYRIRPVYIEELVADLEARRLKPEEERMVTQLANFEFWKSEVEKSLKLVDSTEKYHLQKLLIRDQLPRFSKYLPIFLPYADWLERFMLPQDLGMRAEGGRITNDCQSPVLVMRWAKAVLKKNKEFVELLMILKRALEVYPLGVRDIEELPYEPYVYDISVADNENFMTAQGIFVHNSRAGAQVPFSSLNIGADTSEEGRKVTRNLLLAYEKGLGRGENPIFPNIIFRVKDGVNANPGDPNYDLFKLAIKVAAQRMNPTFSFMDSSFNKPYGCEVSYMGCRTRVIGNRRGPEVTEQRGNLSFTTINLPRLAIKANRSLGKFYQELDAIIDLACRQLYHRYRVQAALKVKDLPFLMGQGLYLDSDKLGPCDPIEEAIKHGTLSVGFIGLAEALVALIGKHHGESDEAQAIGMSLVQYMRNKIDQAAEEYNLNYTLLATPAEGLSGRFVAIDREEYGLIPGVTDKEYYTNSFHIPVSFPISIHDKVAREGVYHKYTNAGHISYVEFSAPPIHNLEAVETIIKHMKNSDMGYAGINFPIDFCDSCSQTGVFPGDECPFCGSISIRRVRRITGYLSTVDRFNDSKVAELHDRIAHKWK
ncbi:MAG: anaerobic ribonucleoside-triphosphate reductase [Firmicutes bacterium]|nr:anaerobic ribonucleoside-triphosphate reductase [Bacillota bacterium]